MLNRRPCLIKPGAHVLVDTNYRHVNVVPGQGCHGAPREWASGTLLRVTHHGKLCTVLMDATGPYAYLTADERHVSHTANRVRPATRPQTASRAVCAESDH